MCDLTFKEMDSILNDMEISDDDIEILNNINFYENFNEYTIYENILLELESKEINDYDMLKEIRWC